MSRKILFIAIGAVVVILIALVVYNLFLRKTVEAPLPEVFTEDGQTQDTEATAEATPTEEDNGFFGIFSPNDSAQSQSNIPRVSAITKEGVFAASLTASGDRVIYVRLSDGTMHTISYAGEGEEQKIFTEIPNLRKVQFNANHTKVLLSFDSETDPDGLSHQVLNLETQEFYDLHPNIGEITWDTTGNQLLYIFNDKERGTIDMSISDSDGSHFRSIRNVSSDLLTLGIIPNTSYAYYYPQANSYYPASLKAIDIDRSSELLMSENRYGFDVLWAPDGKRALFFETVEQGGGRVLLSLYNRETGRIEALNIQTTIDKVVWSKDSTFFYAALPDYLGTRYPDDYLSGLLQTRDTFWKINADTGLVEQVTSGDEVVEDLNATNVFLSSDEQHLFFINQNDNLLYVVNF